MYNFISPKYDLIDSIENYFFQSINDQYNPKLILDLNIIRDFVSLSRYTNSDPKKDEYVRKLLSIIRIHTIELHVELALIERYFDTKNFNYNKIKYIKYYNKLCDEISSKLDSKRIIDKVFIKGEVDLAEKFFEQYKNTMLIEYVGCLKIIEILKNKKICRKTAIVNIFEFLDWLKNIGYISVPLIYLCLNIFGGNVSSRNILKTKKNREAIEVARNACFDLMYFRILELTFSEYNNNKNIWILLTQDSSLTEMLLSFRVMKRGNEDTVVKHIKLNFSNCKFLKDQSSIFQEKIQEINQQALLSNEFSAYKRDQVIQNLFLEKDRLEANL